MEKPITLRIEELKSTLVDNINSSNLPLFIIEPIVKDLYTEIKQTLNQQTIQEKMEYEKSLEEPISNDETN